LVEAGEVCGGWFFGVGRGAFLLPPRRRHDKHQPKSHHARVLAAVLRGALLQDARVGRQLLVFLCVFGFWGREARVSKRKKEAADGASGGGGRRGASGTLPSRRRTRGHKTTPLAPGRARRTWRGRVRRWPIQARALVRRCPQCERERRVAGGGERELVFSLGDSKTPAFCSPSPPCFLARAARGGTEGACGPSGREW
jgi:hypothetical protein